MSIESYIEGYPHCKTTTLLCLQEQELGDLRSQIDIPSLERALGSLREEKRKLDEQVMSLQQELSRVSQQSSARGALEAFRKDKRTKEEQYQNE